MTLPLIDPRQSELSLGAHVEAEHTKFSLFSHHADRVTLCLFSADGLTEIDQRPLTRGADDIWTGRIKGVKEGQLYGYRVDGPYAPSEGHRFNANKLLIDPYAKQLFGDFIQNDALYGYDVHAAQKDLSFSLSDSAAFVPKGVVSTLQYDWETSQKPQTSWADTIIYEAHVKGLTKLHPDIKDSLKGTLSAFKDPKIVDYLKDLGVTAIEFLPVQSFFSEPRLTRAGLTNYWGYNPVNYFAPQRSYLGPQGYFAFQMAVKSLHEAGIEVILDVVYNHTAESWELGPTLSYRGIDNRAYYRLKDDRRYYVNDTGCGNTLNITHPRVRDLAIQSLRYWAEVMQVDGFRFDLGPTLGRNPNDFDKDSAFFKAVQTDPVLKTVKLIAEPWDIGPNGYQLGGFPKGWHEWNDKFRDDVRGFWKNDGGAHRRLAGRLLGSAEQFDHSGKSAHSSINFITAHDGFNLQDTVSYTDKHNLANLEDNRDGHSHNLSDNMGVEGQTDDPKVKAARTRRKKNMLATLLLSQGIPMLLAGDEFGHTQKGNNNAYCQDNALTWINWAEADTDLQDFTKRLLALRKAYPHFRQDQFLHGNPVHALGVKSVEWVAPSGYALSEEDWQNDALSCFGLLLCAKDEDSLLIVINRGEACDFETVNTGWNRVFSTVEKDGALNKIPADAVCAFQHSGVFISAKLHADSLRQRAEETGILQSFRDISGHTHHTQPETNLAFLTALHRLEDVKTDDPTETVQSETDKTSSKPVFGAEKLRKQRKVWGVTVPLYGLKSNRNSGIGDFEDLAVLAESLAKRGADFIGINPVHALFPSAPHLYAPYSASSRNFLNVMHIAVDALPGGAALKALKSVVPDTSGDTVDYAAVYAAKHTAFEQAFETFFACPEENPARKAFAKFEDIGGDALRLHATFDAIFETLPLEKQTYDGWKNFPANLQDAKSKAVMNYETQHPKRVAYYKYLQWVAHTQLKAAQDRAVAAGMSVGLYIDFAVGVVPGGSDAWQEPQAFIPDMSLGAPGDAANPEGQKWNLLPLNPLKLEPSKSGPYTRALRNTMSLGGAVRIDHILGLKRAFWIPDASDTGAYVQYPFDALVTEIADLSTELACVTFGEDLGTVPDGFRNQMAARDLMGCNVLLFERDGRGQLLSPETLRETTMASFSNHDFPTLTGFWKGEDFIWREALGIGGDPDTLSYERQRREDDKAELARFAGLNPAENSEMSIALMTELMALLARSPALAISLQIEDLLLSPFQANVPGTTDEQPNWKRRLPLSISEITEDAGFNQIMESVARHRPKDRL